MAITVAVGTSVVKPEAVEVPKQLESVRDREPTVDSPDDYLAALENQSRYGWGPDRLSIKQAANEYRRRMVYNDGAFNLQLVSLMRVLRRARLMLLELARTDPEFVILEGWREAGLPKLTKNDDEGHRFIEHALDVHQGASAAMWCVEHYISELEGITVEPRRGNGRRPRIQRRRRS